MLVNVLKCKKCGNIVKKDLTTCPFCGDKNIKQKNTCNIILEILQGIIFFCAFFLLTMGSSVWGIKAFCGSIILAMICVIIQLLIDCSANKKIWIGFTCSISLISIFTALMASRGIPEFIRSIQGEDFIGIWIIYSSIVFAIGILTINIFSKFYIDKHSDEILNQKYNDVDLMFINTFSRYKYIGYYILKLKMDRIIEFGTIKTEDKLAETTYIKLTDKYTKDKLMRYCDDNPNVKPIINYLIDREELLDGSVTTINSLIKNVEIPLNFNSEVCEKYAKIYKHYNLIVSMILVIMFTLTFILAYSKLIMGICLGKFISNLLTALLIGAGLAGVVNYAVKFFAEKKVNDKWIKVINEKYSSDCSRKEFDEILDLEVEFDEEKKDKVLKKYVTNDADYIPNTITGINFSNTLLGAVLAAELATRASANTSGCSSCSSCSSCGGGCGGGCGGCGGCGD